MTDQTHKASVTATVAAISGSLATTGTAAGLSTQEAGFIERIKTVPDDAEGKAPWEGARAFGIAVVRALAELLNHQEPEVARNARRALLEIVRENGRPDATKAGKEIEAELLQHLGKGKSSAKRDLLSLLSEIGGEDSVAPIAGLLQNSELRDDARCVLLRIPGARSTEALKSAFHTAPAEFKVALADALRARGEQIEQPASLKMVPCKQTTVAPKA